MTPVKVLVPVSGGKDSQASLKLAVMIHGAENVRGLFCDTQFEHWQTYAHVGALQHMYGVQIDWVSGGSVIEKCIKYGRFPGGGARFCTDELKMRETRIYCKALAIAQGFGFEVWYGMRLDESHERKQRYAGKVGGEVYAPHEVFPGKYPKYLAKLGVMFRLCILEWSEIDVKEFVGYSDLNPLYETFNRVGCFPCLAAGDAHKEKSFAYDDFGQQQKHRVIKISQQINKSIWTSKGGKARNECMICQI